MGNKAPRRKFGLRVFAAPAGLQVWTAFPDDKEDPIDGPFTVLAMGYASDSLSVDTTVEDSYITDAKGRQHHYCSYPVPEGTDLPEDFEFFSMYFYIAVDWANPWVIHGEHAFLSSEAAEKYLAEKMASEERMAAFKAKNDA